jgi:hypothetical protein
MLCNLWPTLQRTVDGSWCRDNERGAFGVIANTLKDLPSYPGFQMEDGVCPFDSSGAANKALADGMARRSVWVGSHPERSQQLH